VEKNKNKKKPSGSPKSISFCVLKMENKYK